ncbi:MAG: DUF3795 domain-containing protein [Angelakisella sp.]|nr:DUF3795 domain-containing protein [Angelakisella sp.]
MKGFVRNDPFFSLCGLNCGLCPMKLGGHCGGCGFGNQSCKIARCSLGHGRVEYCFQCKDYPCQHYEHLDDFDSFITHQRRRSDLEKAQRMGPEAYAREQAERAKLLDWLLTQYNDGRRKTLYCLAVNLLELGALQGAVREMEASPQWPEMDKKEKAALLANRFQQLAEEQGVVLKLRKKPKRGEGLS